MDSLGPCVGFQDFREFWKKRRREKLVCFCFSKPLFKGYFEGCCRMPCFWWSFKGKDFNMIFFLTGGATGGVVWLHFAKRGNFSL